MSDMFGTPDEHEASVQSRMAQRDGVQPAVPHIVKQPGEEGASTDDDTTQAPKVEKPMVVMPDGTMIDPSEHDPYKAERERLENEENRVLNLRDLTVAELGNNPNSSNPPPEEPEGLKIPRIELPEDNEYVDDTQKALVEGVNAIAEAMENQSKETKQNIDDVLKGLETVGNTAGNLQLERQLEAVEARYGVDRKDLFALSRETQISDPEILANVYLGQQAQTAREEEARKNATNQRAEDAGGIGGTSHGSPNGGEPPKREEVDWNDNEALARVYNITKPTPIY